jgi:hypothetical protein
MDEYLKGIMDRNQPTASQGPVTKPNPEWHHEEIKLEGTPFYVRIDTGPNHESALLCINDGEPDTYDVARFNSLKMADVFIDVWRQVRNAKR